MAKMTKARPGQTVPPADAGRSPEVSPELARLLDHIAEMLALDYVRLMENAAREQGGER